jgi:hypothetical protein
VVVLAGRWSRRLVLAGAHSAGGADDEVGWEHVAGLGCRGLAMLPVEDGPAARLHSTDYSLSLENSCFLCLLASQSRLDEQAWASQTALIARRSLEDGQHSRGSIDLAGRACKQASRAAGQVRWQRGRISSSWTTQACTASFEAWGAVQTVQTC